MTDDARSSGGEAAWWVVFKVVLLVAVPAALIYAVKLLMG